MNQIDLFKFKKLVDANKPFIVKFKSDDCPICVDLEPDFEKVSKLFPDLEFYDVDVNEEEDLADMFIDNGVPTLFYVNGKKFKELEYPDDGYDVKSLTKEIKRNISA